MLYEKIYFICPSCLFRLVHAAQLMGRHYVCGRQNWFKHPGKTGAGAKVLDKIPYGTKITLIRQDEELKSITTEGITGYWQKVKYNNKTGYILDSYLFPWAPPKLATVKEMKNYLPRLPSLLAAS